MNRILILFSLLLLSSCAFGKNASSASDSKNHTEASQRINESQGNTDHLFEKME